jgi:YbbR domain-containing protein
VTRISGLGRNWTLKLIALILALLLWALVKGDEPTRVSVANVPVEVELNDGDWRLAEAPQPAVVRVVFSGPVRELVRLAVERPRLIMPVDHVQDSVEMHSLRTHWVRLSEDLARTRAEDVQPITVRLAFDRALTRLVPVSVVTEGQLPPGLAFQGPLVVEPAAVRVTGSSRQLDALETLRLRPMNLDQFTEPALAYLPVDTSGLGPGVQVVPLEVAVYVPIVRTDTDTAAATTPGGVTTGSDESSPPATTPAAETIRSPER